MMRRMLFDIETSRMNVNVFSRFPKYIAYGDVVRDWRILCWTAMDMDTGEIIQDSLHFHPEIFSQDCLDDYGVSYSLWQLFNNADILIAHNGDNFDLKKVKARLIYHGFRPPSPSQSVDTLKIARSKFAFTSNRLGDLAEYLGCDGKLQNEPGLWAKCETGDIKALEDMLRYNLQDVYVLKEVADRLLPWSANTRTYRLYNNAEQHVCPACGSANVIRRQTDHTTGKIRWSCKEKDCGKWSTEHKGKAVSRLT